MKHKSVQRGIHHVLASKILAISGVLTIESQKIRDTSGLLNIAMPTELAHNNGFKGHVAK
jgi:hypothetical protein